MASIRETSDQLEAANKILKFLEALETAMKSGELWTLSLNYNGGALSLGVNASTEPDLQSALVPNLGKAVAGIKLQVETAIVGIAGALALVKPEIAAEYAEDVKPA